MSVQCVGVMSQQIDFMTQQIECVMFLLHEGHNLNLAPPLTWRADALLNSNSLNNLHNTKPETVSKSKSRGRNAPPPCAGPLHELHIGTLISRISLDIA